MNYYNLYDFLNLCNNSEMYNFTIKSKLQKKPKNNILIYIFTSCYKFNTCFKICNG